MNHPLHGFNPKFETERIVSFLRDSAARFRRKGAVLGLSGGVDSALCAALCERAFGSAVLAISMPESECKDATRTLPKSVAEHFGIRLIEEDITSMLRAHQAYHRRNEALRLRAPSFRDGQKFKIAPSPSQEGGVRFFSATIEGAESTPIRLDANSYLGIVAASNFKQRCRKTVEYYHAERNHFCVIGTPNIQEYELGFFVKQGDGSADIKPIAHLYKTQVYALARHLGVPDEITARAPTTDTYPMEQEQGEFFFSLDYEQMDVCLWGVNHQIPAAESAKFLGLPTPQVQRMYDDIAAKKRNAEYLLGDALRLSSAEPIRSAANQVADA